VLRQRFQNPLKPVDDLVARCFVNETGGESPLFQKKKRKGRRE
jgi:hypothetical protein